jgi:Spy/CpxP family protein refolding chaperone
MLTLLALAVSASLTVSPAQEGEATQPAKRRHRLPRYYSQVVTEEQRASIYDLQGEYAPRIEKLEAQLAALEEERDTKIAEVLSPEQRQQVDDLEAAARAKRRAAADAAPAEEEAAPARPTTRATRPRTEP